MSTATKEAPSKNGAGAAALPPQFKSYTRANAVGRGDDPGQPSLSVGSNGAWRCNRALAAQLGLKAGAGLAFHFDGTKEQWYLERDDKNGLVLRADAKGDLTTNSASLRREMSKQFPNDATTGRMLVSNAPERLSGRLLYAIITTGLVTGRKRS